MQEWVTAEYWSAWLPAGGRGGAVGEGACVGLPSGARGLLSCGCGGGGQQRGPGRDTGRHRRVVCGGVVVWMSLRTDEGVKGGWCQMWWVSQTLTFTSDQRSTSIMCGSCECKDALADRKMVAWKAVVGGGT